VSPELEHLLRDLAPQVLEFNTPHRGVPRKLELVSYEL
jgi:hypothetical protein